MIPARRIRQAFIAAFLLAVAANITSSLALAKLRARQRPARPGIGGHV